MTLAPHAQPSSNTRPPTETTVALRFLFGQQEGYIEVGYIAGDPLEDDMRFVPGKRWHRYNWGSAPQIARFYDALAEDYGDVYVSSAIYSQPRRSRMVALPSRVIFTDDAPEQPRLRYSAVCQTSAGKRQAYHLLREPADAATRRELQGLTAATADKSGADIEQMIRIGGYNTKRSTRYRVYWPVLSKITYTPEEIRAAYPSAASATPDAAPASIDWEGASAVTASIDRYVDPDTNIPWHILGHPCSQTYKILSGQQQWAKKDQPGNDPSRMRWHVAEGLHRFFGYPDTILAGILLHYGNFEHLGAASTKGTVDIKVDIARIIGKLHTLHPDVVPRTDLPLPGDGPAAPLPEVPRKRKGRPRAPVDADTLYDWYCSRWATPDGKILYTRRQVAEANNISVPTLDRLERQLRERGLLQRHTSKDRRTSWVVLAGAIKNAEDTAVAAENPVEPVLSEPARIVDARTRMEEHTAPADTAPPPGETAPADDVLEEWAQEALGPLPKRRRKARPLDGLPIPEQIQELHRRRRRVHGKKRHARWIGHDSQVRALERQGEELRKQIEALEATADNRGLPAGQPDPMPPADQLPLEAVPDAIALPGAVCFPLGPSGGVQPLALAFATGAEALQAFYRAWRAQDTATAAAVIDVAERLYPMLDWTPERARLGGAL